jgi:hypothetical protein
MLENDWVFMDIGMLRLANQYISMPSLAQPQDVVAQLGALQAQDYSGVLWSVGLRCQLPPNK